LIKPQALFDSFEVKRSHFRFKKILFVIILKIMIMYLKLFAFLFIVAPLLANDATLKKIEQYLDELPRIEAKFLQINPNGSMVDGIFYIDRKNKKLRLNYPSKGQYIVARVGFLYVVDEKQKTVDYVDASYTPVGILLQNHIRFNRNVFIKKTDYVKDDIFLTISDSSSNESGLMVLHFTMMPKVDLKGWTIQDMQGNITQVIIHSLKNNVAFNEKLFEKPILR
jgi:outer membrane lipoprotein-sorting protein